MHDYNLFRVQLNHTPEYSRPEIKMDLTSLVPKRTSISSDTSSAPFTCHRLFLSAIAGICFVSSASYQESPGKVTFPGSYKLFQ